MAILTLPSKGENGTVETLIWEALQAEYPDPTEAAEEFIADMPTGRSNNLTTREKARFSAALAATCTYDPSCMVHWMWQSNKGYQSLLAHDCFEEQVTFLDSI